MKQKAGPAAIIIAIVALVIFCYFMFRVSFAPRQPDVSPENAPAYAKAAMKGQRPQPPGSSPQKTPPYGGPSQPAAPAYGRSAQQGTPPYGGPPH